MQDTILNSDAIWWGTFDLAVGDTLTHNVGPANLVVERTHQEWRISVTRYPNSTSAHPSANNNATVEPTVHRFALRQTHGPLRISPVTADRPVVSEPVDPLHIVPGATVTFYVSTPVWYCIEVGDPRVALLDDFIVRSSDTWFGPSTREGDLCYASRTAGRLDIFKLPVRPERAITAVTVRNKTEAVLPLQRLSLPAPHLAMYADAKGMLWTQDITLAQIENSELAELTIKDGPPVGANAPKRLNTARERGGHSGFFRAFGAIFS